MPGGEVSPPPRGSSTSGEPTGEVMGATEVTGIVGLQEVTVALGSWGSVWF